MEKIVYVIDNLKIGGAQKHLINLTKELNKADFSIEIICLGKFDNILISKINVPVFMLKMDCVWSMSFWISFIKLIKIFCKNKPQIVHTYLNTSNVFGVLAAKLAGIPIIISSRRDLGHFRSHTIGLLEKLSTVLCSMIVCVSEVVRIKGVKVEKLPLAKTKVIYNGVDIDFYKKNSSGKNVKDELFRISMVGSMDREAKGHFYFIKAAELILEKKKSVKFYLIGDGHLEDSLIKYVKSRNIDKYFVFRGRRHNLVEELKNTDLLVVPSESEGCSNALLEAMAMGIPAIATAVEGNLEIIENGANGYLVESKNPSAIAEKITSLLNSPGRIKELGDNAKLRVIEKFTLKKMTDNYNKLYGNLLIKKGLKIDKRLKVGYVVSLFPCWSETFILNEIIELEKRGVNINILSIRGDLEDFIQDKAKPFIEKTSYINNFGLVSSVFSWFIKKPFILLSLFWMVLAKKYLSFDKLFKNLWCVCTGCYFSKIVLKKRIQHVHAHFATYPALTALVISKLSGIPFSFTAHAHDIFLDKTLLKEKAHSAKSIITISEYNKRYLIDYCKNGVASKINVVHCGLDLTEYMPLDDGIEKKDNIIVSVGRLAKIKGFEHLIKACAMIKSKIIFKCYIVGDGPLKRELKALIEKLGLTEYVFLKGVLDSDNVKKLLYEAKVCVLPCVWDEKTDGQDGIPLVLMEALAQGIPAISSRISGIPELIDDGKNGFLTKPGDVIALSERILDLLNNQELENKCSKEGRFKVEQEFDIKKSADSLVKLFSVIN